MGAVRRGGPLVLVAGEGGSFLVFTVEPIKSGTYVAPKWVAPKKKAPRIAPKCLKLLVGHQGLEP